MLGEIEQAILQRLKQAEASLGYQYGRLLILNASPSDAISKKLTQQQPVMWLQQQPHYQPPSQDGEGLHFYPHLALWVQTSSLFNQGVVRQSATPGLYQLMLDASLLLAGQTFDLPIAPLILSEFDVQTEELHEGKAVACGKLSWQTCFTARADHDEQALNHINLSWLHHQHATNYQLDINLIK